MIEEHHQPKKRIGRLVAEYAAEFGFDDHTAESFIGAVNDIFDDAFKSTGDVRVLFFDSLMRAPGPPWLVAYSSSFPNGIHVGDHVAWGVRRCKVTSIEHCYQRLRGVDELEFFTHVFVDIK